MTRLLTIALMVAASAAGAAAPVLKFEPFHSDVARLIVSEVARDHLSHRAADDTVSARAWTNLLSGLDYDRLYFTAEDIRAFRSAELTLDDDLRAGDLDFAAAVFSKFVERVEERLSFTESILAKGFDFTKDEYFEWRRRDMPWPAAGAERDELWRRKIKNDYVRELVLRRIAANAATNAPSAESAATNAPPAGAETSSTNSAPPQAILPEKTVEETILERQRQAMTVFRDSDSEWLLQKYMSAFTRAYDPHSDYMSPSTAEDFDIGMKLSLFGIGALLSPDDGAAKVVRLIPGGPADRDKRPFRLQPNDRIVAVAQGSDPPVDILHWPLHKTVAIIRGPKGTKVVLTVIPASDPTGSTTKTVDLVRDEVRLEDQEAKLRIEDVRGENGEGPVKVAVVRIPAFYANMKVRSKRSPEYKSAAQDVEALIAQALKEGAKGMVLDLRGNGGGSLLEAIRMTGLFIRNGPVVQVMESEGFTVLQDRDPSIAFAGPLVVLVNRLSASASEILSAALQDYGRAIIVGDAKTHGKGTVQSVRPLGPDPKFGSIKATTAVFYRVNGLSTQLEAVRPDIPLPSPLDYMELGEEFLPNPLRSSPVPPAVYGPLFDLSALTTELKRRSETRRAADPRQPVYAKVLQRVRELHESRRLPLKLEDRMSLARMEEEIRDIESDFSDSGEEDDTGRNGKPDLAEEEAVRIVADIVTLCPDMEGQILDNRGPPDLGNWLQQMLRRSAL
ncbi:MAG: hypothetical protein FJ224_00980 [Lentisphaerae bacterium]|nr:hypothetical protein [Lentisphaerota bacterium]